MIEKPTNIGYLLSALPKNSVCPCGLTTLLTGVVIIREQIIFICRSESNGSFLEVLKDVALFLLNLEMKRFIKDILLTKLSIL